MRAKLEGGVTSSQPTRSLKPPTINIQSQRYLSADLPGFAAAKTARFARNTALYTIFWFSVNFPFAGKEQVTSETETYNNKKSMCEIGFNRYIIGDLWGEE